MEGERVYPYLGVFYVKKAEDITDSVCYVVLFNSPDMGTVVHNNTQLPGVVFASYGSFDESKFEVLTPGVPVRLSN